MAEIEDVAAYIIEKYPHRHELSNARLTKLVYLADWKHVLEEGRQITEIRWYFDNYGPFVRDVKEALEKSTDFVTSEEQNCYGSKKLRFELKVQHRPTKLSSSEKAAVNHVIEVSRTLYWKDFIKLVYSTYPIASSQRYSYLNLVNKALEYKQSAEAVPAL